MKIYFAARHTRTLNQFLLDLEANILYSYEQAVLGIFAKEEIKNLEDLRKVKNEIKKV